jgi:hypothetical protein
MPVPAVHQNWGIDAPATAPFVMKRGSSAT